MTAHRSGSPMLAICTVILVCAAMHFASSILAPMTCGLFIVALAWPLYRTLQRRLPSLVALAIVILICTAVVGTLGSAVVWGVARVGRWLVDNVGNFQALYQQKAEWLAQHDVYVGALAIEYFNVPWLLRQFQSITLQLQGFLSFAVITFIFLMLGLLEVDMTSAKFSRMANRTAGRILLGGATDAAARFRRYMLVRTLMSVMTGLAVWGFARVAGLDLAVEWGVIAFAMNYIPFIGPLFATLLPTALAAAQFASIETALMVFAGLNVIQFVIGSYIEPLIAGATLSLSPFLVLFAVFFGSFLWGLPGAFIGVPILIGVASLCAQSPSTAWLSELLAGRPPEIST
jgi:AI-2 transport protein TqsA